MSDEAGFLRAIAADLHDDLPRLAYADWLDDRGDHRGEYLRLQVELARTWTYLDQKPHLYARLSELSANIDPGWLAAVRRCTTPAPPVDVAKLFPELAPLARTAVRLHPRPGDAPVDASKLGGPILWPQREPWPDCPEHGTPLVPVVQLRKADVPEVGFPPGTDLFQLLWCPIEHESTGYAPHPRAYWRKRQSVALPLYPMPDVPKEYDPAECLLPNPCVFHPERVTEFPDPSDLPPTSEDLLGASEQLQLLAGALQQMRVQKWSVPTSGRYLYYSWLSCARGTKIGGHASWFQDPWNPECSCGAPTEHLMTFASNEHDGASWGRWLAIEDRLSLNTHFRERQHVNAAAGLCFGDVGSCYVFVCRRCPGWPIQVYMQCP